MTDTIGLGMQGLQPRVDAVGVGIRDVMVSFLSRYMDQGQMGDGDAELPAAEVAYYVSQLHRIATTYDWSTLVIRWSHFAAFDAQVATSLQAGYIRHLDNLNEALVFVLQQYFADEFASRGRCTPAIAFSQVPRSFSVRTLRSEMIGQLCSISGTVTRTSQVRPELLAGVFRCADCGTESELIQQQFRFTEPLSCRNPNCENKARFTLVPDHKLTRFGDWQKIRLQENANQIPVGCMPRTLEVVCRNDAVEVAKPGDRVVVAGCGIVVPEVAKLFNIANRREVQRALGGAGRANADEQQLQQLEGVTGLKALGVRDLNYRMCFLACTVADSAGDERKMTMASKDSGASHTPEVHITPAEMERIISMRHTGNILTSLSRCVAPNIFKHDLVKTGLLLQILGGVPKVTIEGIRLRGDINACIIGDPSTAKSHFLKWVSTNVPRGIYTSGKASTASGLTATVTRDADTGERTIEAGALMLADHGVCCIDEFDKMDIKDQVAIHEAMEQQTISIAKAGIKATLNARTSLLAALNPIGGRYDRRKPLQRNIAMSAPIMSRFDLMFCIVDDAGEESDFMIADSILKLHRLGDVSFNPTFTTEEFQLYIKLAKSLTPRMTPEAMTSIANAYKQMRMQDSLSNRNRVYRVTTRMLESIIRLSEAAAKLYLADDVIDYHVKIALEIMRASLSTIDMAEVELVASHEGPPPTPTSESDPTGATSTAASGKDKKKKNPTKQESQTAKAPPKKVTISADHFSSVVNKLVAKVHQTQGLTRDELFKWYLGGLATNSVEQLEREHTVVRLVLNRLITEGKVIEMGLPEDPVERLYLDPNYNPDVSAH